MKEDRPAVSGTVPTWKDGSHGRVYVLSFDNTETISQGLPVDARTNRKRLMKNRLSWYLKVSLHNIY